MIFVHREGDWRVPLGDYLGDLTNDIPPNERITEFVSAGPKTYGLRLSSVRSYMRVKGITLHAQNSERDHFDSLKQMVLDYGTGSKEIVLQQRGILRNKKMWRIETGSLKKTLRVVYDKRVLLKDFRTLSYGN